MDSSSHPIKMKTDVWNSCSPCVPPEDPGYLLPSPTSRCTDSLKMRLCSARLPSCAGISKLLAGGESTSTAAYSMKKWWLHGASHVQLQRCDSAHAVYMYMWVLLYNQCVHDSFRSVSFSKHGPSWNVIRLKVMSLSIFEHFSYSQERLRQWFVEVGEYDMFPIFCNN